MDSRLDTLYPLHMKALKIAKLATNSFPRMKDVIEKMELKAAERKETIKNKRMSRQTFFCIGVSEVWKQKNAIGAILKTLRNKY